MIKLKKPRKELSIIITSFRNPWVLKLCIESIQKTTRDLDLEIIVADSMTEEDTDFLMSEEFPEIKFLPFEKNVGFGHLVNQGIAASQGKFILAVNADIIVTPESIQHILDFMKENPSVGLAGPKLLGFNGKPQASCFEFYTPLVVIYRRTFLGKFGFAKKRLDRFTLKGHNLQKPTDVDWMMGSALIATRSAIQKIGWFDRRFFMYFEDVDWCRRFWEKGFRVVYFPGSVMYHYHGQGSKSGNVLKSLLLNKLTLIHIMSGIKYFIKYLGKPNPRIEGKAKS